MEIFYYLFFIILIILDIGNIYKNILFFEHLPIDGFFQIYNPLKRLASGQDFYFFHGPGIVFIHYPIYLLFGKNFFSCELSRNLISFLIFYTSFFIILYAFNFSNKQIIIFFIFFNLLVRKFFNLESLIYPENSLYSVRTGFILILYAFLFLLLKKRIILTKKRIIIFIFLTFSSSMAIFFSTENGLYYTISLILFLNLYLNKILKIKIFKKLRDYFLINFFYIITFLISLLLFYLILFKKNAFNILKYNLIDVGNDQFWYFGIPPAPFLTNFNDFFKFYSMGFKLFLFMLSFFLVYFANIKKIIKKTEYIFLLTLKFYNLISFFSLFGIFNESYLLSMFRIELIIFFFLFNKFLKRSKLSLNYSKNIANFFILSSIFLLIPTIYSFKQEFVKFLIKKNIYKKNNYYSNVFLSREWMATYEFVKKNLTHNLSIWSSYVSLPEDILNKFNPSKFDYIIHAVGKKNRYEYLKILKENYPDYIITINPINFSWEKWLLIHNWDFYDFLFKNYKIKHITSYHLFWQKIKKNNMKLLFKSKNINIEIKDLYKGKIFHLNNFDLNSYKSYLVIFNIDYEIKNIYKKILIGNIFKYIFLLETNDNQYFISLPPYENNMKFGIFIKNNFINKPLEIKLTLGIYPKFYKNKNLPGISVKVKNISYEILDIVEKEFFSYLN